MKSQYRDDILSKLDKTKTISREGFFDMFKNKKEEDNFKPSFIELYTYILTNQKKYLDKVAKFYSKFGSILKKYDKIDKTGGFNNDLLKNINSELNSIRTESLNILKKFNINIKDIEKSYETSDAKLCFIFGYYSQGDDRYPTSIDIQLYKFYIPKNKTEYVGFDYDILNNIPEYTPTEQDINFLLSEIKNVITEDYKIYKKAKDIESIYDKVDEDDDDNFIDTPLSIGWDIVDQGYYPYTRDILPTDKLENMILSYNK